MQRIRQKIILFLFSVLLFSGAVSAITAPHNHDSESITDPHLLHALQMLEQQAEKETLIIEALNERIRVLESKIAALNSILLEQSTSNIAENISAQPEKSQQTSAEPVHFNAGAVTTQRDTEASNEFLSMDGIFDFDSRYFFPTLSVLLVILMVLLLVRIYQKKQNNPPEKQHSKITVNTADTTVKNPIETNEKNALVAQKLAALRSAVKQGKQRRQHSI